MIVKTVLVIISELALRIISFGLGIDWGSEYHKSTMLLPKTGFRMVENHTSGRKTPSVISICDNERFFESQAVAKFNRIACETLIFSNRYFTHLALSDDKSVDAMLNTFYDKELKYND